MPVECKGLLFREVSLHAVSEAAQLICVTIAQVTEAWRLALNAYWHLASAARSELFLAPETSKAALLLLTFRHCGCSVGLIENAIAEARSVAFEAHRHFAPSARFE